MKNIKIKFLLPGELFVSKQPYKINTILGSCVSVILYNKKYHFGGMNHYMLPLKGDEKDNDFNDNRYGDVSISKLLSLMLNFDKNIKNIEAKIFGGGNVVSSITSTDIGKHNVNIAYQMLSKHKIPIMNKFVCKNYGLKIQFDNFNNKVFVRKIRNSKKLQSLKTNTSKNICVVTKEKISFNKLQKIIGKGNSLNEVDLADNLFLARTLIMKNRYETLIVDVSIPYFDVEEFFKSLRKSDDEMNILLLTTRTEMKNKKKYIKYKKIYKDDLLDK